MELDLDALVDTEARVISRELFVNREIYESELERIFARAVPGHVARPIDAPQANS